MVARSPITLSDSITASRAEVIPRLHLLETLASRQLLGMDAVSEPLAWESVLATLRVVVEALS